MNEPITSPALNALYQDILLEHHQDPRNFGEMVRPDRQAEGYNPLCGDRVCIQLKIDPQKPGKIAQIKFKGEGCSICMASASMMTEEVAGHEMSEITASISNFRQMMQGQKDGSVFEGDLRSLEGVKRFPVRIKCALLPWMTLKDALEGKQNG